MNAYTFEQTNIGLTESFSVTVTEEMMRAFLALTGDQNPLHCDDWYARDQGYPDRVVYGMLTASFYSTLAGVYLPGKYCLLHSIEAKFLRPVFIGDILRIDGNVAEKHEAFRMILVKATIYNQRDEKVSRATIQIGYLPNE